GGRGPEVARGRVLRDHVQAVGRGEPVLERLQADGRSARADVSAKDRGEELAHGSHHGATGGVVPKGKCPGRGEAVWVIREPADHARRAEIMVTGRRTGGQSGLLRFVCSRNEGHPMTGRVAGPGPGAEKLCPRRDHPAAAGSSTGLSASGRPLAAAYCSSFL